MEKLKPRVKSHRKEESFLWHSYPDDREALHRDEPDSISLKTSEIPGPIGKEFTQRLDAHYDTQNIELPLDYDNCVGNFAFDLDGNILLDCFTQMSSLPLGYQHPNLVSYAQENSLSSVLVQPCMSTFPPKDLPELVEALIRHAPAPVFTEVYFARTGAEAVSSALRCAYMIAGRRKHGDTISDEHLKSAAKGEPPGCPRYGVLSFEGAYHGRTLDAVSLTFSNPMHKLGFTSVPWFSCAPFPQLKHPLAQFADHNEKEEVHCIKEVERILIESQRGPHPIFAVIVEPIQGGGGDRHATPRFFKNLRDITLRMGILLLVDEIQTGCGATGTMWATQQWALDNPCDFVIFGKKAQACGYYAHREAHPTMPKRMFSTWVGDWLRLRESSLIMDTIVQNNYLEHINRIGEHFQAGLNLLNRLYPNFVMDPRVRGGWGSFDCPDHTRAKNFQKSVLHKGLIVNLAGDRSIQFRFSLVFRDWHLKIVLDVLYSTLNDFTAATTSMETGAIDFKPTSKAHEPDATMGIFE